MVSIAGRCGGFYLRYWYGCLENECAESLGVRFLLLQLLLHPLHRHLEEKTYETLKQKKRMQPKLYPLFAWLAWGHKVIPLESKWSAWNPNSNAVVILCKSHHYRALEGNFYLLQNKRQSSFFSKCHTSVTHFTYIRAYIHTESRQTFRFWTIILKNSFYCFTIDKYHYVA